MPNHSHNTDMCAAILAGDINALKSSLELGANPNYDNGKPLYLAALHNQLECLKHLIEAGATVSAQNYLMWSQAAKNGSTQVLEYLITHHEIPMPQLVQCVNDALYTNQLHAAQILAQQNLNYLNSLISVAQHMGTNFKTIEFFKTHKTQIEKNH